MDDALSGLLHEVRPQGALFDQSALNPPWSLRFLERTPLALLTMVSGTAWVTPDGSEPVPLRPGDIVLVRGPEPYTVSDDPGTAPLALVHEGDRCTTPDGRLILGDMPMCSPERQEIVLLKGTYQVRGSVSQRVLDALPPIARVPAAAEGCPPLGMISLEIARDVPGRQVVLDRLLDLLLVTTLRDWFERPEAQAPAWYRAHGDPTVGRALRLIHGDPARPWTVAALASEAGASRARFAQRFSELVGQPPMTYLTEWRICLAADLLARTDDTVEAVSRQVGYSNAYALSVAFKRTMGIRPSEHRAIARAGELPVLASAAG
ncbi:AraC family transcriptional regulator [Streptomyces albipurpureus]|uniref:AraC family transcriptional regulator n=1 Tax=Streptomyces albipurpureus TaxID=2897419 RepID=A0ABT0UXN0_9ACTN|nr:AraC family transcriptional regulator [Streptomyces sp. CWNU-1]MCM2393333.1 AraC family transcriptional regulator [Streptomyces sp. CWNU-1]